MSIAIRRFTDQTPKLGRYSLLAIRYSLLHGGSPL